MGLSNSSDVVLSRAQNLQVPVITIHNYLCCMGVLCTWAKLLTDLQNLGAVNCVWRPGSVRTRWGSYSAPQDPLAIIRGRAEGKKRVGNGEGDEV